MGKFSRPAEEMAQPKPPSQCESCGWSFARDNALLRRHGKMERTEPRTQINVTRNGFTVVRCSDCFERELLNTKAHTKSGTEGEDLYRQGINYDRY